MRIAITQAEGSLPFITELPSFGIGQLEGYNGVGKSLTVSVLELCAGVRPRMEARAWQGFCEGMGRLTVTATELRETTRLEWVLEGELLWDRSRDADAAAAPELEWFAEVRVGDRSAQSLDEIRRLFAVERVNGDVGLTEELAGRADVAVRELDGFATRLLSSDRLGMVETHIGELRRVLDELSLDRISERAQVAARRRRECRAAEQVLRDAVERRAHVEDAVRLRARLDEIAVRGADLEAQIRALDDRIAPLTVQRRDVARQLDEAEKAAAQTGDLRAELESARRSYKRANTRLGNIMRDLAAANQRAGIDDDDDPGRRRAELEEHLADLRRRRLEADAGPAVIELIDRVHPPITHAIARGLAEQPLLSAPARAPSAWTIAEVADALGRRRDELSDIPSPRHAQRIDDEISVVTSQLAALREVERLREQRARAAQRLNEAQQRSHDLTERLDRATSERLDELRDARRALDDQLSELGGERAVLTYRRDSLGAPQERDALSGQLSALLDQLGVSEQELDAAYAAALQAAEQERDAFIHLRELERSAAGEHERDVAHVQRTIDALRSESQHTWIAASALSLPTTEQPLADQLEALARLQVAARRADDRLTDFRQLFPGIRASLEAVADELRGRTPKAAVRVREVFDWLERDAASWFADDDFRAALLGEQAADVAVDLRTRQVSWTSGDGERHTKPIEALSSGERAFAFTQARLALLQQRAGSVANRLIALDEFGAFVSANRIRQLSEYLHRWRETHQGDQILVILPANQDYATLARATGGVQADRYMRMAAALREREWFVEEFDVP
jgi:predicted  nucleic acid-binding Zn-ribbon protein